MMATRQKFTPSSICLVTGANGHVAQHVVQQLLSRPTNSRPRVRATVRSDSAAQALSDVFKEHISLGVLEIVLISNIAEPGVFDKAVQGCTHIAHIASPLVVGAKDAEQDVIIPAIQGTLSLLKSSASSQSLESVVITSSFAAVFDAAHDMRPGYTYTPSDWNPISYQAAASPNLDTSAWPLRYQNFITYMASKKLAEKAAWDFYAEQKPKWRLSVINPTYIGGPCVLPLMKGVDSLSYSQQLIWNTANSKPSDQLREIDFPHWVDVRDVAKAHLLALTTPGAEGQRFILAPNKISYADIAAVARNKCGMNPSTEEQTLECFEIESTNCQTVLGIDKWVSFEDMVRDTINQVRVVGR